MSSCTRHPHERGVSPCRRCGEAWCGDCLVYAFGGKKLPYCMSCAMFAGGIRTIAARPALPKREVKRLLKATKVEAKSNAQQSRSGSTPDGFTPVGDVPTQAKPPASDWETPWWEDRQPTFAE